MAAYSGFTARGAAVESATVASDGQATFSSLTDGVPYTLEGNDGGGVARRIRLRKSSAFAAAQTQPWKSRRDGRVTAAATVTRGVATLASGTVVVSTSAIKAASGVFLERVNVGESQAALQVSARSADTSFTILSSDGADTGVVRWTIITPAA